MFFGHFNYLALYKLLPDDIPESRLVLGTAVFNSTVTLVLPSSVRPGIPPPINKKLNKIIYFYKIPCSGINHRTSVDMITI